MEQEQNFLCASEDRRRSEELFDFGKGFLTPGNPLKLLSFPKGGKEKESLITRTGKEARKGGETPNKLLHFFHISGTLHIDDRMAFF